jgi:hypothetical protein
MAALSGTVKDSNNANAARLVRVYRRDSGSHVGTVVSDGTTGAWSVTTADTTEHFAIVHDGTVDDANVLAVSLLLHGDGANNSTVFTDISKGKVLTPYGGAKISTTQSKFGGSSMYFDGAGDYIGAPSASDLIFGSGAFTVELFFYRAGAGDQSYMETLIDFRASDTNSTAFSVGTKSTGDVGTYGYPTGSSWTARGTFTANAWNHIAVVSTGSTGYFFLNGVQQWTGSMGSTNYTEGTLKIGAAVSTTYTFNGYVDEVRVTKGVARYTADFTPPNAAFSFVSGGTSNAIIYDRLVPV